MIIKIYYVCNGKKCEITECRMKEIMHIEVAKLYADNKPFRYISTCCHTKDSKYALNGPIKGPIDLIKRFKLHVKPGIYLGEKLNLGD